MMCNRCNLDRKCFSDGLCGVCQIVTSRRMPGVLGLNPLMSDPFNPKASVDQHNAIEGMYRRGEISDHRASYWDKLFTGRAQVIEHQESQPTPSWLRQANEEADHNEQGQYVDRENATKKSAQELKNIDAAIASEGLE